MTDMTLEGLNCFLDIEEEVLKFQFQKDNETIKQITLKAGYKTISDAFFKRKIPSDAEIEFAINSIEDELMSNKELSGRKGYLFSSDGKLIAIFKKNGLNERAYSRQSVEDLFSQYARVVMGSPAAGVDAEITREDVAIILLLREIMHHLDFEELRVIG